MEAQLGAPDGLLMHHKDPEEEVSSVANAMILFNPACVFAPIDGVALSSWNREKMKERVGIAPKEPSPVHHVSLGHPPNV